ncbi:MAG: alpha/beta fold hydrolase [Acidobacteria bacterium]|nr:MAG: alpha/beta fold hydrolase [Acidobacteriota bacterium]REK11520.1 MAG: alpha/beta fold hydrolase [Acidobacteriota bacterium]
MSFLQRPDGVRLFFESHGDPAAPTILLSHGFSATSRMWIPQVEALSRDHHLILWDLRGHGRSSYPEDPALYGHDLCVEDMAALLDEHGVEQAIVGGLSLGGFLSLAFHAAHPGRVAALLIVDTGPGYKSEQARAAWNERAEATARDLETNGLAALRSRSAEMAAEQHRSAEGLVHAARRMLTQHDDRVIRSLPTISAPSLIVVGADDQPFLAASAYMAGKIPRAGHVVIADAGHAVNLDQPEAFNREVVDFLARLP